MKLLTRYNRVNIVATLLVLLVSAISYYFLIRSILINQLDKDLKIEENEIVDFIRENKQFPEPTNYKDEQEEFIPANGSQIIRRYKSLTLYDEEHKENILYRQLEFPLTFSGKHYRIVVRKSEEKTDNLIKLIVEITIGIVLTLLITLFIINRFLLNNLWKPFNVTLQQMKQFNLSGREKVDLKKSNIAEFTELNEAVSIMTERVTQDYDEIKNFTENASHEIQTPLAIIKSKLELISQSENLKEDQVNNIQSAFEAVNRLSKLNQSLILLTKIDNRQFQESEEVNMSDLINRSCFNYEELILAERINITKNIESNVKLTMNETLAEILISNLITNAIKHNLDNGFIQINLTKGQLSISNTGATLDSLPETLFERFKKNMVSSDSLGLGLSIVKKICEKYDYHIDYNYQNPLHQITIYF